MSSSGMKAYNEKFKDLKLSPEKVVEVDFKRDRKFRHSSNKSKKGYQTRGAFGYNK